MGCNKIHLCFTGKGEYTLEVLMLLTAETTCNSGYVTNMNTVHIVVVDIATSLITANGVG